MSIVTRTIAGCKGYIICPRIENLVGYPVGVRTTGDQVEVIGVAENDVAAVESFMETYVQGNDPIPTRTEGAIVIPTPGTVLNIGSGGARFGVVFCESISQTSDRNAKTDITSLPASVAAALVNTLQPVSFRYSDFTAGQYGTITHRRTHFGFIAQDVADALVVNNMTPADYGIYCEDDIAPDATVAPAVAADGKIRSLRTEQIIPLLVGALQAANARIASLENDVATLKSIARA